MSLAVVRIPPGAQTADPVWSSYPKLTTHHFIWYLPLIYLDYIYIKYKYIHHY